MTNRTITRLPEPDAQSVSAASTSQSSSSDGELWEPTGDCAKLLLAQEIVVPVVGAGVSCSGGLPGSADFRSALIEEFRSEVAAFSEDADLRTIADEFVRDDPERSIRLRRWVADFWRAELEKVQPDDFVRTLIRVPSRMIVTFNYDSLLEKAADAESRPCDSLADLYDISKFESLVRSESPPARLTILHLHGSERIPRTIALDRTGYRDVGDAIRRLYHVLMPSRRLCYLGTSLDEAHIIDTYHRSVSSGPPHVLFVDAQTAENMGRRGMLSEATHGVKRCVLPSQDHMRAVVRHLARPLRDRPPELAEEVRVALAPPSDYVRTVLATGGDADESTIDLQAQLSIDAHWDWPVGTPTSFLTEEDLVAGPRNLVLGAPGSGKTELLHYASQVVPPQQAPILIRLVDVPLDVADSLTRLSRWAKRGVTSQVGVGLAKESLESRSFHLLLDGLDEVAPPFQGRLAKQILGLAEAFPQHSFTVTSRPVDAVAALNAGWRTVALRPGTVWQRRYLEHRNVDLNDLVDQLVNGRDLIDLLKLPFFLTRVVALDEQRALGGLDLWGVLQRLVDLTLGAEDARELLPVSATTARDWLRHAALAMQLAGRTVLAFDEIEQVPLPIGVAAEKQEICEGLVQRAMLRRRDEGYGFVHRILGEALAAEALEELEPSDELLDSIAPVRSDAVQGVRADWRVSMSFLASASARWRAALKVRDELQWARSLPSTAAADERREAARLLWDTYTEWDIWIWDYELPDVIQDSNALGRLLQSPELSDITDEIRAAIDGPTGRIQGNAIKVLSVARDEQLEPELRRVLEDDEREAVVRRKAAIAAADLGYRSLLPLIVPRAAHPAEDVETQDCMIAAMKLAIDDELVDVARAVLPNQTARGLALARLEKDLTPRDLVLVLADYAAVDASPYSSEKSLVLHSMTRVQDADSEVVQAAARTAVIWDLHSEELLELLGRDHQAALAGIRSGIENSRTGWWAAYRLLTLFSAEELEAAGAPELVVTRRRQQDDPAYQEEVEAAIAEARATRTEVSEPEPPKLSALLNSVSEGAAWTIQHHAHHFSAEVNDLTDDERLRLSERLREWEEDKPFSDAITWKTRGENGSSWSIEHWANAFLWFGPALGIKLSPHRWAEIATSEVVYENHYKWLHSVASEEAKLRAAELCTSVEARAWCDLLRATPDPLPDRFVARLIERLEVPGTSAYPMREVAQRLVEAKRLDAVRALAAKSSDLETTLRPFLGKAGDQHALERLFQQLIDELRGGHVPDTDELGWLEGVTGPRWLRPLFEAIALLAQSPAERAGFTANPILNMISAIDGDEAIAGYDQLLATGATEFRFLRLQRQAIADAELSKDGIAAAPVAARAAGLPALA